MGLQFYLGSSGAGKSTTLYYDIIEQSNREPDTRFFIIVPDQFTMQTQKTLVELVSHQKKGQSGSFRSGIMNIDVLSFGRLTHHIFEEMGGNRKPVLDDTGKSLILRKIAREQQENLLVIGKQLKKQGYIHEVKSAISEFMQYGIDQKEMEALTEYAKQRGTLHSKLKDLAVLYDAFLKEIDGKFVTTEGLFGLLAQVLEQSERIKDSVIVFDGFTGFTPIQLEVIGKLLTLAREVKVTVIMDQTENPYEQDEEQKLFAFSKKMVRSLCKVADSLGVERKDDIFLPGEGKAIPRFQKSAALAHLEKELFRYPSHPYEGKQDAICLSEALNYREEVADTCLRIRKLIREQGYQYRDIAVVAGDLSAYADYVTEEFEQFQIPYYIDMTKGIELNPFVEYIRCALKIIINRFAYEDVFSFLRSGMVDIPLEKIDLLENYVIRHGIRGRKKWSELFVRRSEKETEIETLDQINETRARFIEILEPLLGEMTTAKDYVNQIYTFLVKNNSYEKLEQYEKLFQEENNLAKAKEYSQIYRHVMELLEQIYDLIGDESMSLQEFADILDAGFGEIKIGTIPQNVDRILVGDMERTRLQEIKVLFFLGINDGNIPRNGAKGGIISDIDREFLAQGEWEISPSPRQQMYIQRLYLYMNMTKPSERLYLSFSHMSGDGKALKPSYLVPMICRLFPKMGIDDKKEWSLADRIETPENGLKRLAGFLRDYAKGTLTNTDEFFTLYHYYQEQEKYQKALKEMVAAAFFRYQGTTLGEEIAHALYGSVLLSSVSRLEQYASCAYSYFLEYGLSLQERKEFSFEAVDMGTLYHSILKSFARMLKEEGLDWFHFTPEQGNTLLEQAVEEASATFGDSVLFSTARYQYAITRMKRILKRTIFTLQEQLQKGRFAPEQFEVSFSSISDIEAVNISLSQKEKIHLQGRIDRVDTCRDGDNVYVKIIDYKSGNKKLDIAAIYYGLQLQLVVYMNAATELIKKKEPEKNVIPAALLYYHISDPLIKAEGEMLSEEMVNAKIRESLRMEGVVNEKDDIISLLDQAFEGKSTVIPVERKKDGNLSSHSSTLTNEQLQIVSDYANTKIKDIGRSILQGEISQSPYEYSQSTGCDYCTYQSVCGFNMRLAGYDRRRLKKLSSDEALQAMQGGE